jgi:phospholipid transport system substrate-binding protein
VKPDARRVHVVLLIVSLAFFGSGRLAAEILPPEELVRQTTDRMLALLNKNRTAIEADRSTLYGFVDEVVLPHFDFNRMAQWVLGKYWRTASQEQRQRFVEQFRNLLVRTYGTLLLDYSGQTIDYLPARTGANGDTVTIRTLIADKDGTKVQVDYALYRRDTAWKVYDVRVNGISLVSNYRNTFGSKVRQDGIDSLIDDLAQRNKQART